MKRTCTCLPMLALLGFAAVASGQTPSGAPGLEGSSTGTSAGRSHPAATPGSESRVAVWLRLQAEGGAASPHPQQASGAERELANQRLLDSYRYPIPEYMPRSDGGQAAR